MYYKHHKMPSEFLGIKDEYAAYCLDEAIAFISCELSAGKKLKVKKRDENGRLKSDYRGFGQLYSKYKQIGGVCNGL